MVSPAQPRRAETRLSTGSAASSKTEKAEVEVQVKEGFEFARPEPQP